MGHIKFNSFCTAKETISEIKSQPTELEKICANDVDNEGLLSKICMKFEKCIETFLILLFGNFRGKMSIFSLFFCHGISNV